MGWLLVKDLQLLRRSPLLTALLVIYPIVISVLIGFALSGGPDKPRVAFLNLVPSDTPFNLGAEEFDVVGARGELCERIECVTVQTREEAVEKVSSGEVLAALILPEDLVTKLRSLGGLTPERPVVEVVVNEEDPVKGQFVDDRISALLAEANLQLSQEVTRIGVGYLDTLVRGGEFSFLGRSFVVLGMERAVEILTALAGDLPPGSPARRAVADVIRFATLARDNLDIADELLAAVSSPIAVDKQVVSGDTPTLETFAISVSVAFTLMFVTVLLVAGSLALEREEHAYGRLTRGLLSPEALLAAKLALGLVCSLVVTALMLVGLELFVSLEWQRSALWVAAIGLGALAFGAFGAGIGALAADVRAASLLAFMISMPIAFLSLVPSGTVGKTAFDLIEIVTAAFPFDPALRAFEAAFQSGGPDLGLALAHLAILTAAWGLIARLGLRRLA